MAMARPAEAVAPALRPATPEEPELSLQEPLLGSGRAAEAGAGAGPGRGRSRGQGPAATLLLSCLAACMGSFSFGFTVGYTSPALGPMAAQLGLSQSTQALFSSLVALGAMPGALGAGPFSERVGRRAALAVAAALLAAHWLAIGVSSASGILLLSRFVGGAGVGMASLTVPVYMAEAATEDLRGTLGASNQLFITLGTMAVYVTGLLIVAPAPGTPPSAASTALSTKGPGALWEGGEAAGALTPLVLPPTLAHSAPDTILGLPGWRLLALAGLLPALALLLSMPFIPESPRWLARHGSAADARAALCRLRGVRPGRSGGAADAEAGERGRGEGGEVAEAEQERALESEMEGIMGALEKEREGAERGGEQQEGLGAQAKQLLQPSCFKPLMVSIGLMVVQQLSGINAVIFFAASIFASAGFANPNLPSCAVAVIQVLFTCVSTLLIDRLGRRPLLLASSAGMAVAAFGLGLAFLLQQQPGPHVASLAAGSWPHVASLAAGSGFTGMLAGICCVGFIIAFGLGIGPIPWLVMAEVLPASVKGAASSLVVVTNWFLCFTITQTFPFLLALSPFGVFWMYSAVCLAGVLFIFRSVPETKNRSLEEISAFFK